MPDGTLVFYQAFQIILFCAFLKYFKLVVIVIEQVEGQGGGYTLRVTLLVSISVRS